MLNRIIKEDLFSTFTQLKLIDIERMDSSKNGNPKFKLKFEYADGEDTRVMFIYTENDCSINYAICNNMIGRLFNVGVFVPHFHEYHAKNPNYRLSTLHQLN